MTPNQNTGPLHAVATGDIVASSDLAADKRAGVPAAVRHAYAAVATHLGDQDHYPIDLFGGDSWQIYFDDPRTALTAAVQFRAVLFADSGIQTRMAIAIDTIDFLNEKNLSESDGIAFRRSGRALGAMRNMNLELLVPGDDRSTASVAGRAIARCIDLAASTWTRAQAQAIAHVTGCILAGNPCSQADVGSRWRPEPITQQAVGRHLSSAAWNTVSAVLEDYGALVDLLIAARPRARPN